MRVIGIVEGGERGFVDDFGLEGEIGSLVRIEFVQLLYSSGR